MATNELLSDVKVLEEKIRGVNLPAELQERASQMVSRLARMVKFGEYSAEYERVAGYIDLVVNLPWDKKTTDVLDLKHAKEVLDQRHYGLEKIKERVLEYMAVLSLQKARSDQKENAGHSPVLCFVGLVGTGKTTIASAIAEAMGRKLARIPFGGMGSPLDLRGQSRIQADAEPGLIIKAIRRTGSKNPVILLDEIDRVTDEGKSGIMGVLIELLDPEQNNSFRDHFLDHPFDLSEALFIATCNNMTNISMAVADRLEPIQMPSYSDEEKITIGRNYILPKIIKEYGLNKNTLEVRDDVWPKIVRPLGYDAGIRTLERTIAGVCRKVARMTVEGKGQSFSITLENIKDYLPNW